MTARRPRRSADRRSGEVVDGRGLPGRKADRRPRQLDAIHRQSRKLSRRATGQNTRAVPPRLTMRRPLEGRRRHSIAAPPYSRGDDVLLILSAGSSGTQDRCCHRRQGRGDASHGPRLSGDASLGGISGRNSGHNSARQRTNSTEMLYSAVELIRDAAMPSNPQRKLPFHPARPAYRTLQGWALGTLIEQGAVVECEHHGHRCDRADPDAWNRASEEAWRNPFPGVTPEACLAALDEVMRGDRRRLSRLLTPAIGTQILRMDVSADPRIAVSSWYCGRGARVHCGGDDPLSRCRTPEHTRARQPR